jgi:hypothetical protein
VVAPAPTLNIFFNILRCSKTGKGRSKTEKGRSKTEKGRSKAEKDVPKQDRTF